MSTHDAKGLRFDIYAEDDHGNRFDIEMQVLDKHNLPQRIRFYQSTLALDSYERGENYLQARNAYVIFFCCFDPFGRSDQWYRIRRGIDSGQTGDEVLGFLTTIRKWPAEEAHRYYQQALEKIKK